MIELQNFGTYKLKQAKKIRIGTNDRKRHEVYIKLRKSKLLASHCRLTDHRRSQITSLSRLPKKGRCTSEWRCFKNNEQIGGQNIITQVAIN